MHKTFIIAELGINHNGDINIAKQLIKIAKDCNCNAVKFQKRNINSVYTQEELNKYRESPWGTTNRQQKEGLELNKDEYDEIDRYCKEIGIDWFASAWDLKSLTFLDRYNLKYMKIASALLAHTELITEIAKRKKYTFISTGMSTFNEIGDAVNIFREYGENFELMHCNSQYPMPDEDANLSAINSLKMKYGCKVGYSCHSTGILLSALAVIMGASSIEKHITLDRSMYGTDQSASVESQGLKRLIDYIELAEKSFGHGRKIITEGEWEVRKKLRRTEDYDKLT